MAQPMKSLDDFARQMAQQLLTLRDEGTGLEVGLTPFELDQVGKKLSALAQAMIEQDLRRMQRE